MGKHKHFYTLLQMFKGLKHTVIIKKTYSLDKVEDMLINEPDSGEKYMAVCGKNVPYGSAVKASR